MPGPGHADSTISTETSKDDTTNAFKGWQGEAYSAFDTLAEKLLDDLDVIVSAAATNDSLSFTEKLTLLANYVGNGQPLRAFPFLDQNCYRKWLEGTEEPRLEMQTAIIQLCQAEIASTFHEGSSFDRVLSYLPFVKRLQSPVLHSVTAESDKLWFDPWLELRSSEFWEVLPVRAGNCILNENIRFLGQLVQKTEAEILRTPNFGRVSLLELKEVLLTPLNVRFGMSHPELDRFNEELKQKQEARLRERGVEA